MLSPAGVFSGTSGKQKTTQEWISAKLNCPTRLSLFMGLNKRRRERKRHFVKIKLIDDTIQLLTYMAQNKKSNFDDNHSKHNIVLSNLFDFSFKGFF